MLYPLISNVKFMENGRRPNPTGRPDRGRGMAGFPLDPPLMLVAFRDGFTSANKDNIGPVTTASK